MCSSDLENVPLKILHVDPIEEDDDDDEDVDTSTPDEDPDDDDLLPEFEDLVDES